MNRRDTQIVYLAFFPWALAIIFAFMRPQLMLPAVKSKVGIIAIAGMILWEFLGVKAARIFIKGDDFRARLKLIPIMLIFFFPVVFTVVLGPVAFQYYTSR